MPKSTPTPLPPVRSFADACCQAMALSKDFDDVRSLAITVDGDAAWAG